jgi:membrane associated rhomboid family serine protease
MLRLTPVVKNLLIVNVIVFVAQFIAPAIMLYFGLYNVHMTEFKPYQLFTYMFVHDGFFHIGFNMLMLAFSGPILEEFWGQKRFLLLYMIGGVGAGIFYIIIELIFGIDTRSIMWGASGAVYAVMTAFGIIFSEMQLRPLLLPFSFKAKYLVLVLGSLAIWSTVRPSAGDRVAHAAHLGGILIAIILVQFWRGSGNSRG